MLNMKSIREEAQFTIDEQGKSIVKIPANIWETIIAHLEQETNEPAIVPQHEQIQALLKEWKETPDDTPAEWWDEFEQFLRDHRLNFPLRDLGLDDE